MLKVSHRKVLKSPVHRGIYQDPLRTGKENIKTDLNPELLRLRESIQDLLLESSRGHLTGPEVIRDLRGGLQSGTLGHREGIPEADLNPEADPDPEEDILGPGLPALAEYLQDDSDPGRQVPVGVVADLGIAIFRKFTAEDILRGGVRPQEEGPGVQLGEFLFYRAPTVSPPWPRWRN